MKTLSKTDALGNPVIVGGTYGYSQSINGVSHVVVGEAVRETEKAVTLKPISKISGLWSNAPLKKDELARSVSVKAMHLFPVDVAKLNHLSLNKVVWDSGFSYELGYDTGKPTSYGNKCISMKTGVTRGQEISVPEDQIKPFSGELVSQLAKKYDIGIKTF